MDWLMNMAGWLGIGVIALIAGAGLIAFFVEFPEDAIYHDPDED